ncbi:UDP-glucose 4-epimerase family protein [Pseudomonas sp. NPDC078700]|uniref:UDP-glucose 4-epimerase family protein n=1 Tax=Pseudomonas sp. NPDC078700 TaxID=3364424 RepID=UPI0037C88BAA
MNILLTGASGFVGRELLQQLTIGGHKVTAAVRMHNTNLDPSVSQELITGLTVDQDWMHMLQGQDIVIHLAARVHVMNETSLDPLDAFRAVNLHGTLKLAKQAAASSVKRFIFVSSVKVNGESTQLNYPYKTDTPAMPVDPYGISKMEAEQGLFELANASDMNVVIVRPVLVYGPGVQANFLSMMSWLNKGIPLPFGSIQNLRSMVALDNLTDLIVTCLDHPAAANQVFLVSDDEDLSTTTLLKKMGSALGRPPRLISLPGWLLQMIFTGVGKKAIGQRLCGSLQVDISKTRDLLGWTPRVSVDDALRKTASDFLEGRDK